MKSNYVWEEPYQAAILETDHARLQGRIQEAKAAIDERLHELLMDHGGTPEERNAISDALAALDAVRRELSDNQPSRANGPGRPTSGTA